MITKLISTAVAVIVVGLSAPAFATKWCVCHEKRSGNDSFLNKWVLVDDGGNSPLVGGPNCDPSGAVSCRDQAASPIWSCGTSDAAGTAGSLANHIAHGDNLITDDIDVCRKPGDKPEHGF